MICADNLIIINFHIYVLNMDISLVMRVICLKTAIHVPKGPYPLEQRTIGRVKSANSHRPIPVGGDTIGGQILNMFNTENRPTLRRICQRLWTISRRLYYTRTHTPIVEESALELALESADSSSESADSNVDSPKIGTWVQAL